MAGEFDKYISDIQDESVTTPASEVSPKKQPKTQMDLSGLLSNPALSKSKDVVDILKTLPIVKQARGLTAPTATNIFSQNLPLVLKAAQQTPIGQQAPIVGGILQEFYKRSESARAIPFEAALDQIGVSGLSELGQKAITNPEELKQYFGELPTRIKDALLGKEDVEFGDVMRERGVPESIASPVGFALEMATDPLTYVGLKGSKQVNQIYKDQLVEEAKRIKPDMIDDLPFILKPSKNVEDFTQEIKKVEDQLVNLRQHKEIYPEEFYNVREKELAKNINTLKVDQILVGAEDFANSTIQRTPKALSLISTYIERQGQYGKTLARLIERTSNQMDRMKAGWISRFEPTGNLGKTLGKLTREQKFKLMARMEGHIDNTGDQAVEAAYKIADINRKEIANQALVKGIKTKTAQGIDRPFITREHYAPHYVLDPTDVLNTNGQALKDSLEYSVRTGKFQSLDEAKQVWDSYSEAARSAFKELDVPVNEKTKAFFNWMVSSGQAKDANVAALKFKRFMNEVRSPRFNSLETARTVNVPFYDVDPTRVLTRYYSGAAKRLSEIEHYGGQDEVVNTLIEKIGQQTDKETMEDVLNMVNLIGGKKTIKDIGIRGAVQVIRNIEAASKLNTAFIMNATQSVNTASIIGLRNTVKAFTDAFKKEGREYAFKAGTIFNEYTQGLYGIGGDDISAKFAKLVLEKLTPFQAIERNNRLISALGAKHFVDDLVRDLIQGQGKTVGAANAARQLRKLDIRPERILASGKVELDDYMKASGNLTNRTQFRARVQDAPEWASSDWGKLVNQFKNFIENQWKFSREELLKEAKEGNFAPLARYSILAPTIGKEARELKQWITGQNPNLDIKTQPEKYIEGAANLGAVGMLYDVMKGVQYNQDSWILNLVPALTDVGETTYNATKIFEPQFNRMFLNRDDARILNVKPILKQAAQDTPVANFLKTPLGDMLKTDQERKQYATRILREAIEKGVELGPVKDALKERFGFSGLEVAQRETSARQAINTQIKKTRKLRRAGLRKGEIGKLLTELGFGEETQ